MNVLYIPEVWEQNVVDSAPSFHPDTPRHSTMQHFVAQVDSA